MESTCACVLGPWPIGLEHSCPWPRECLSSERLSLASDFFCVLGLGREPCVLDSTFGNQLLTMSGSSDWIFKGYGEAEMETGRVAGWVEILRLAGQAG